ALIAMSIRNPNDELDMYARLSQRDRADLIACLMAIHHSMASNKNNGPDNNCILTGADLPAVSLHPQSATLVITIPTTPTSVEYTHPRGHFYCATTLCATLIGQVVGRFRERGADASYKGMGLDAVEEMNEHDQMVF